MKKEGPPLSVRQLKREFLDYVGVGHGVTSLRNLTKEQGKFYDRLNDLGWQRKTRRAEDCDDVDATAILSQAEYDQLTAEYKESFQPDSAMGI